MRLTHFKGAVIAGLLMLASASLAEARQFTDAEKTGLSDAVKVFDTAMHSKDYEKIVAVIPPRVIKSMSEKYGVPVEQLQAVIIQQTQTAFASVTLESFGMDLKATSYLETPDGTPYALIPTVSVMQLGTGKMKAEAATLGIIDEGVWYLLRVSEKKQVELLKSVYPSFKDVELPEGTLEPVK